MAAGTSLAFSGSEGASFLELPVGARPAAMGSAYSSLAEDAYAPTWNPAGLAFVDQPQFAGMHMTYVESTAFEYGSVAVPLGDTRGIGASIQYFRPGTINALDEQANPIGTFSGYYANYALAFGQALGQNFGVGVTGNLIRASIDDASGSAAGVDAGLLFRPNRQWRVAAVVANAGQKLKLINTGDSLPLLYRLGGAYHPTPSWTIALEGVQRQSGLGSVHTGVEYETPFGFSVRTGYDTERTRGLSAMSGLSFGLSLLAWNQDFSYAFIPLGQLGSSHLFSVVLRFGRTRTNLEDTHHLQRPPAEDAGFGLDNL